MSSGRKIVYCALIIFQVIKGLGFYHISADISNWTVASSQCTPATPKINFKGHGEHSVEILKHDLLFQGETVWTGYYKTDMTFELIGCVKRRDIPNSAQLCRDEIDKSPSRCYPCCENSVGVGVAENECYCLESSPSGWNKSLDNNDCKKTCKEPKGMACGGEKGDNKYVSLYKTSPNVLAKHGDSKSSEEENQCSSVKVICTGQGKCSGISPSYGAITKDKKDKFSLYFTKEDGLKKVLCEEEKVSTGTTDTTTCSMETTEPDREEMKVTTQSHRSTADTMIKTQEPSGNGVAVAVSITVVLVIIAAIVTGIFIRKRCLYTHRFDKMPESSESPPGHEYAYPDLSYDREAARNTPDAVEYNYPDFALQNADNYPDFALQNADNISQYVDIPGASSHVATVPNTELETYESSYNVATNNNDLAGSYNTTCTRNKVHLIQQESGSLKSEDGQKENTYNTLQNENSYNTLGARPKFESGPTYDHNPNRKFVSSDDNTYDLSMSPNQKLKQSHDAFTDNVYMIDNET